MPHFKKRRKRKKNCADIGVFSNVPPTSETIEQNLEFSATHSDTIKQISDSNTTQSDKKPAKPCIGLILPGLRKFSQGLSKFSKVSAPTFEMIGGAV